MSHKRTLYVGGLADATTATALTAAFVPFGPVKNTEIPMDHKAGKHKGFAFVEFEDVDDAAEAMFNMDGAEFLGRVLNVKVGMDNRNGLKSNTSLWSKAEFHEKADNDKSGEGENAKE